MLKIYILLLDALVKEYGMTIQGFLDIPVAIIFYDEGLKYEDAYWKAKCNMNRVKAKFYRVNSQICV